MRRTRAILIIVALLGLAAALILYATHRASPPSPPVEPAAPQAPPAPASDAPKAAPVPGPVAKEAATDPSVTALQPGSVGGMFRDKDSGEGVAGVPISAYWWKSRRLGNDTSYGLSKAAEVTSGADGRFEIPGLMPGPYLLARGETRGYMPCAADERVRVEVHSGERLDGLVIDLTRGVPISGHVIDERRAPIEHAEVHLTQRNYLEPRVTFTDANGGFDFAGAQTGDLAMLEAAAPGYMAMRLGRDADGRSQIVGPQGLLGVEIMLGPGRSFEGVLVDEAGQPIANASIRADQMIWGSQECTKADGSFLLMGFMPQITEVMLRGGIDDRMLEFLDGTDLVHLGPQPHTKGIRAVARLKSADEHLEEYRKRNSNPEPKMTTGRLVDEAGNPVDGVEVAAGMAMMESGPLPPFTVSGPDGRFAIDFGSLQQATLVVSGEGIVFDKFDGIRAGSKDNVLTVRRSLAINGVVRDAATGEPVTRFRVAVLPPGREWSPGVTGLGPMNTSEEFWTPDGRFTVNTQMPETVKLGVAAPGYGPVQQVVALGSAGQAEPVEFLLPPEATAGGIVVDSAGRPIASAKVVALTWEQGQMVGGARATTGEDGRFVLTGLEAKAYTLRAMQRGCVPAEAGIDLTRQAKADVRIVLVNTGTVEGRVIRDGAPVPNESVEIRCLDDADPQQEEYSFNKTEFTDSDGHYRILDVPAGTYEVRCDVFDTRESEKEEKRETKVAPGMMTEVNFP